MNLRLFTFVVAITLITPCGNPRAQAAPPIQGTVFSNSRGPISGVTVSLVHPTLGRTTPAFTQAGGYYFFTNVPPGQTYYIEAYWGNQLLYRGTVNYGGGSITYNIPLP
jgi:hypothetical protein